MELEVELGWKARKGFEFGVRPSPEVCWVIDGRSDERGDGIEGDG